MSQIGHSSKIEQGISKIQSDIQAMISRVCNLINQAERCLFAIHGNSPNPASPPVSLSDGPSNAPVVDLHEVLQNKIGTLETLVQKIESGH